MIKYCTCPNRTYYLPKRYISLKVEKTLLDTPKRPAPNAKMNK